MTAVLQIVTTVTIFAYRSNGLTRVRRDFPSGTRAVMFRPSAVMGARLKSNVTEYFEISLPDDFTAHVPASTFRIVSPLEQLAEATDD